MLPLERPALAGLDDADVKAMANLLDDYTQPYVTRDGHFRLLSNFAASQYKNGEPYVAEALDPDGTQGAPVWTYDSPGHSERDNHSGFVDPVITGLIGLRPASDDVAGVSPLTPAAWDHYGAGKGFTIVQDCGALHRQDALGPVQAPSPAGRSPSRRRRGSTTCSPTPRVTRTPGPPRPTRSAATTSPRSTTAS